jgi:glycosyltransferase involved in cell wall biosynthesis
VPRYRRLAARHGVEGLFRFCGTVSGMEKWYQAADGFLHPTFFDACSLALPEAMSSGLPVLASRHDGSAEPITEGLEGVLVEDPRDLAALAAGLEKMLDMDFRQSAGKAARALMLKTPFRDPAVEMLEIYREALMSSPSTVN